MQQILHKFSPGFFMAPHRHKEARMILVLGGEKKESEFFRSCSLTRGDFYFRPPYFLHHNLAGENGAIYMRLSVSQNALKKYLTHEGWQIRGGHMDFTETFISKLMNTPFAGDILLPELSSGRFFQTHLPKASPINSLAWKLSNVETVKQTLENYGEHYGIANYALTRLFKKTYGLTPSSYRLQGQIQHALGLLFETNRSLAEISLDCGFSDQSHLTRKFRDEIGITPGRFRSQLLAA